MLDPRIGQLMRNGKIVHYAFVNGYNKPEFVGSVEEVEVALGVRAEKKMPVEIEVAAAVQADRLPTWNVTLSFEYPAWDEVDGIEFPGIVAKNKAQANAYARRQAESDGHARRGKGKYWFSATLV